MSDKLKQSMEEEKIICDYCGKEVKGDYTEVAGIMCNNCYKGDEFVKQSMEWKKMRKGREWVKKLVDKTKLAKDCKPNEIVINADTAFDFILKVKNQELSKQRQSIAEKLNEMPTSLSHKLRVGENEMACKKLNCTMNAIKLHNSLADGFDEGYETARNDYMKWRDDLINSLSNEGIE